MSCWSALEYKILLEAVERGTPVRSLVLEVQQKTGRSSKSIERKLQQIGFLGKGGETCRGKLGHVR